MILNDREHSIIGITGAIGSGKTTVAKMLREMGAYVINADIIAREILLPNSEAALTIHKRFGGGVMLRGSEIVDRRKLAQRVFSSQSEMRKLNSIMLPLIKEEMRKRAETAVRVYGYRVIIFDAPLLIEAGLTDEVDEIWLIVCDNETKIKRIVSRDVCSEEEAEKRINARVSDDELSKYADKIIENNGDYDSLKKAVAKLYKEHNAKNNFF